MGEQVRSVRDKGAPGGGRALSAAHSFGPSGAGYRRAEDTGREGSAHRGCVCLAPPGHLGRARNRIGVRGRCGGGTGSSAATGKRQELPSRCRSSVWSQRHPPIKGCKGLGSLATPCSQPLGGGGTAWVCEAGLCGLQGVATELLSFQRAWEGHLPSWRVTVG